MNIEELSKSQLILLTILVNFVTSIATGILTVSLLDQAPAVVTQTINRVVEHTIETVAQATPVVSTIAAPAPSNQDLVTVALGADASRVAAIFPADAGTSTPAIAIGTYLSKSHIVVTAAQDALPKEAKITFTDGSSASASLARRGQGLAIYGFANDAVFPKISAASIIAASSLKLGQTVLAIGADGSASTGIVSRVGGTKVFTTLQENGAGSAAVDLSGNLIGIGAGGKVAGLFISADTITSLLMATSSVVTTATSSQEYK